LLHTLHTYRQTSDILAWWELLRSLMFDTHTHTHTHTHAHAHTHTHIDEMDMFAFVRMFACTLFDARSSDNNTHTHTHTHTNMHSKGKEKHHADTHNNTHTHTYIHTHTHHKYEYIISVLTFYRAFVALFAHCTRSTHTQGERSGSGPLFPTHTRSRSHIMTLFKPMNTANTYIHTHTHARNRRIHTHTHTHKSKGTHTHTHTHTHTQTDTSSSEWLMTQFEYLVCPPTGLLYTSLLLSLHNDSNNNNNNNKNNNNNNINKSNNNNNNNKKNNNSNNNNLTIEYLQFLRDLFSLPNCSYILKHTIMSSYPSNSPNVSGTRFPSVQWCY